MYCLLAHLPRWIKREETQEEEEKDSKEALNSGPKLDLGFKEGQTIRINISVSWGHFHDRVVIMQKLMMVFHGGMKYI